VKDNSSYCFKFHEMSRPAGLEPAPFCLEGGGFRTQEPVPNQTI
jgi:hypothetical protein